MNAILYEQLNLFVKILYGFPYKIDEKQIHSFLEWRMICQKISVFLKWHVKE